MNESDTEIVLSIMQNAGFSHTQEEKEVESIFQYFLTFQADVVLLNTCAIREKAEQKIWDRLGFFNNMKHKQRRNIMVGVLGWKIE